MVSGWRSVLSSCPAPGRCSPRSSSRDRPAASVSRRCCSQSRSPSASRSPCLFFALAGRGLVERIKRIPLPRARPPHRRRCRDAGARRRAGLQRAAAAAATRSRLHGRHPARPHRQPRRTARPRPRRSGHRREQGPRQVHERRIRARVLRDGAEHHGHRAVAQHAGRRGGRPRGAPRRGGARRLLGLLVHQLPAQHPACRRRGMPHTATRGCG